MKKIIKKNTGYTIIETMIAVSLFIIIVMAGMGALLNANLLHQKSEDLRSIMDNLSFMMEDMGRNLRTGYNYHCILVDDFSLTALNTATSGSNCWGIAFESADGVRSNQSDQWVYFINDGKIYKATNAPYTNAETDPSTAFIRLTPDEIFIDESASGFSVLGAEPFPGDSQQPFITIRLVGKITYKNIETPFSLQTSVSQRLIDI
jgi:type II secretory pathway pseudopilin PulG